MLIFRPVTLQRYVLREFVIAFGLALAACTCFMLLATFIMKADDYEEFGATPAQIALLSPYLLPAVFAYTVPLAGMIAAIMVFGRLTAENEILAAHAGGVPLRALALPIGICGIFMSGFCLWCNQGGVNWGYSTIRNEVLKIDKPEFFKSMEKEGSSITKKMEGGDVIKLSLLTHERDGATGIVRRPIFIAYFKNQDVGETLLAKDYTSAYHGTITERKLILTLKDAQVLGQRPSFCGEMALDIPLPAPSTLINFGETRGNKGWWQNFVDAQLVTRSIGKRRQFLLQRCADFGAQALAGSLGDPGAMPMSGAQWSEGRIAFEAVQGAIERAREDEAECWRKVALSVLPFSMVILGIGLGMLVKKRNRLVGFILGILVYFLMYYPMMNVSRELASHHSLGFWCLFSPNIVMLGLGVILCRAADRGGLPAWLSALWTEPVATETGLPQAVDVFSGALIVRGAWRVVLVFWRPMISICLRLFGRKTDGYVIGSFVASLAAVLCCVGAIYPALDFVEHGSEIIQGVLKAGEPVFGSNLPVREEGQAVWDVFTYYAIHSLELICTLLPVLILISGLLCVSALIRNREHLILKSSGVPLQRAFLPILVVGLLFSLGVAVLQETALPRMIMLRKYLKPLVYHQSAPPTAVVVHTTDADLKPVMFEMSQYDPKSQEGKNLRVYLLSETLESRIPVVMADSAHWNGNAWKLRTEPPEETPETTKSAQPKAPALDYGILLRARNDGGGTGLKGEIKPLFNAKTQVKEWRGTVTPSFLESEYSGTGVLTLGELLTASNVQPELRVEWWRRASAWVMGLFLLCMTIPLLLHEEVYGLLYGVGYSILVAGIYWGLCMGCSEITRQQKLPEWMPLLPHVLSGAASVWLYLLKMET